MLSLFVDSSPFISQIHSTVPLVLSGKIVTIMS